MSEGAFRRYGGRAMRCGVGMIGAALLVLAGTGAALSCEAVPRVALALYDSTHEGQARDTRIHRFAELVLNHLGQVVVYHDIARGGEPAVPAHDVGLVMSWFVDGTADLAAMDGWLGQEGFCDGQPRIVAFGDLAPWAALPAAMAGMGVASDTATHAVGAMAEVAYRDVGLLDFETDYLIAPGEYRGVDFLPEARPLLGLAVPGTEITLAVIGPRGGYVHDSATVMWAPPGQGAWIIDPFAFFEAVLDNAAVPRPDITTFQGLRTFFATVSSVGWLDIMPARAFGEPERLASEVMVERLIEPYTDLPLSVAILAGDLIPGLGGPAAVRGLQAARQALASPNVEPAVQGFSDVRDWEFFASYDAAREAAMLASPEADAGQGALVSSAMQTLRDAFTETGASTFSRTPGAPRKYAETPFDLTAEVSGAVAQVQALAAEGRPVGLYAWSGNARPFEAALSAEEATGLPGMGGGGGVMDALRPTLTGLGAMSSPVGGMRQVHDALDGDAAYTGYWTEPISGFYGLHETLRRSDAPRRLKPFQLAFAARSVLNFETRRAIETFLDAARTAEVVPVHASRYAATVEGFMTAHITPEGPGLWRIRDRGALQTMRLDDAGDRLVDMARSEGVMGARREGDRLYVALAPGVDAPLIALDQGDAPSGMRLEGTAPALARSRAVIERWNRSACSAEMELSGFDAAEIVLTGAPDTSYGVAISGVDEGREHPVMSDGGGEIRVTVPTAPGGLRGFAVRGGC